jgi:dimeric dUTPase (all-alpha-NTP-PPase superfamily)
MLYTPAKSCGADSMNVQDFDSKTTASEDRLREIFTKQRLLMEKYEEIEEKNGLLQTKDIPVSLHCRFGQARLKDFAWRITEELAEAREAYDIHPELLDHVHEEVADALHFLTELTILAGVTPEQVYNGIMSGSSTEKQEDPLGTIFYLLTHERVHARKPRRDLHEAMSRTITSLGLMCNTLKNKVWKNTHMVTDENLFKQHLYYTWENFFILCIAYDIDAARLDDLYFRKNKVNQFRQTSNY